MSAFTNANREAFNNLSEEYNTKPWQHKISQQVASALQQRKAWIGAKWVKEGEPSFGREVRLLDYACGTGSITQALGPFVSNIRGIDISENMVQKYNETARASGLTPEQANAVVGDLCAEKIPDHLSGPEWYNFDIAVIGLGFHHFEDPKLAIKRLTERLKPESGVLVIVDFLPFEREANGTNMHTIKHTGFNRAQMMKLCEDAGSLSDFAFNALDEQAVMEFPEGTKHRTIFIAKAKREPTLYGKFYNWVSGLQRASAEQFRVYEEDVPAKLNFTGGKSQDIIPERFNYTGGRDYNRGVRDPDRDQKME